MCDKVIVAPDDCTVPSHVCKYGSVWLNLGERGLDRLNHLLRGRLTVSEAADVLGRKLPLVRTEQGRHLPNVVGYGRQLADRGRVVADADD